jgi:transcriptional regulator with XRE-family HTH domain
MKRIVIMSRETVVLKPEMRRFIQDKRKRRSWSRMELAMRAKVALSSVVRFETGHPVDIGLAHAIVETLGIEYPENECPWISDGQR